MSGRDIYIVGSATYLPYRNWDLKEDADREADSKVMARGYEVRRVDNEHESIRNMLRVAVTSAFAIVIEGDVGSPLEMDLRVDNHTFREEALNGLEKLAKQGVHIVAMNGHLMDPDKNGAFIEVSTPGTEAGWEELASVGLEMTLTGALIHHLDKLVNPG